MAEFKTKIKKFAHVDPVLLAAVSALVVLGTVMVYSASSLTAAERFGDSAYFLKRQLLWGAVGFFVMVAMFFVNARMLRKIAYPGLVGILGLLLVTEYTQAGVTVNHATRWITVFGFTFQPSELAKPVLLLFVAAYVAKNGDRIRNFIPGLLPLLLAVIAVLVLILKQPDFGTAVTLALAVGMMLFVGQARMSHLATLGVLGVGLGYYLIQGASYRRQRLLSFLDPWQDPQGTGFQIIQSLVAFSRGGFQGQGLGDGTQKLLYLPEAHTDFIYSVIAEELGLLGSLIVIVLFACIVIQGCRLALRIRDPFRSQLALGLTGLIGIQAFLNMAVVMALLPTKGLTLPLVSYGGTSLVAMLGSVGILLSLSSTVTVSGKMARRRIS